MPKRYQGKHVSPETKVDSALDILDEVQLDEGILQSEEDDLLDEGLETRIMPALDDLEDQDLPDALDEEDLSLEIQDDGVHLDEADAEFEEGLDAGLDVEPEFLPDFLDEEDEEDEIFSPFEDEEEDEGFDAGDLDAGLDVEPEPVFEDEEGEEDEGLDAGLDVEPEPVIEDEGEEGFLSSLADEEDDDNVEGEEEEEDEEDPDATGILPWEVDLPEGAPALLAAPGVSTAAFAAIDSEDETEVLELEAEEVEGTGGEEADEPAKESFWKSLKEKKSKKKASHAKKKPKGKVVAIVAGCIVGLLAILYFAGVWFFSQHFGPSTTIDGVNCALKTAEEAQAIVQEQEDTYVLTIAEREEQVETVVGTDIALDFQPGDDFKKAMDSQNSWQWFLRFLPLSWTDALHLDIEKEYQCGQLTYNQELFDTVVGGLTAMQPSNMAPPVNAKLHFDDQSKTYSIVDEILGTTLDNDLTRQSIADCINGYKMDLDLDEAGCYVAPTLTADSEEMALRKEICDKYFPFAIDYDLGNDRIEQLNGETFLSWCIELPKPEPEPEPEEEAASAEAPVAGALAHPQSNGTLQVAVDGEEGQEPGPTETPETAEPTPTPAPTPAPTEDPDTINTPSSDTAYLMIDYQYVEVPASVNIGTTYNIPISAIQGWVNSFASRVNTVGSSRTFITRDTGESTSVSGGSYGWSVDEESETKAILETLLSKKYEKREPIYATKAEVHAAPGEPDWGDTYIEVSITSQQLYLIQKGELTYQCGVVTGLPNGYKNTPTGVYDINSKQSPSKLVGEPLPGSTKPEYETWVTYWMAVVGGAVGIHDATWQYWGFGGDIYTWNGSHGCINVSYDSAAYLYGQTYVGMPVIIHY